MNFEEEIKKEKNIKILSIFNKIKGISNQEKEQLKLITLWETIENFDESKSKFTTHLYNNARFKYLKFINKSVKENLKKTVDNSLHLAYNYNETSEVLNDLPPLFQIVIYDRFILKLSIKEIAKNYNIKYKQAIKLINLVKNKVKDIIYE